ncbi:MAG: Ig-like domain-containing protein [Planctomycetota bacterium]|nr:Ig-like domain-containing protein [Planctomycetota bacterium]
MSDLISQASREQFSMHKPSRLLFISSLLASILASCSGGSSATGSSGNAAAGAGAGGRCADTSNFCLLSCDLTCGATGCQVTQVAENQRLQFRFSQPIALASVSGSSFSIRTAHGISPDGRFEVNNQAITFVPSISVTNGISSFGFQRNESYILTLPAGAQGVHSSSGGLLSREFSCTVTATLGIIDEDNAPPLASLVAPQNQSAAPVDATFVLRFSEVIDTAPLLGSLSATSPIRFLLRRSRLDPVTLVRVCDQSGVPIVLGGIPRIALELVNGRNVSTVTFKPNVNLPGFSCVQVQVTSDLRDLSGKPAVAVEFAVFTEFAPQSDFTFTELFASPLRFDPVISGGIWSSGAHPAEIGGDGRHGSFEATLGTTINTGIYEWNTDNFSIPASRTLNGQTATITDGKFFFTDFFLPANTTVRFIGNNPAQIFVRGEVQIGGRLEANAAAMTLFSNRQTNSLTTVILGQAGGAAGAGGGSGGKGGDRCRGTGPTLVNGVQAENGVFGGNAKVLLGHAYANNTLLTGGRGSPLFPAAGQSTLLAGYNTIQAVYYSATASGGGGGGYMSAGLFGLVTTPGPAATNPVGLQISGTPNPGGIAFSLTPFPPQSNYQSLTHYLVGGSGGGGGGSHPLWALQYQPLAPSNPWVAGAGGSGGGGAYALRAGGTLSVLSTGVLEAKGGTGVQFKGDDPNTPAVEAPNFPTNNYGVASPGGGGSGGSMLLQSSRAISMLGRIDSSGGGGSVTGGWATSSVTPNIVSTGGRGSDGFYRIEALRGAAVTVTPAAGAMIPVYSASTNLGELVDRDAFVGCASTYRNSSLVFPPDWLRYELVVELNGETQLYSDDPSVPSLGPADNSLVPVRVSFQGTRFNTANGLAEPGSQGPWRDFVNLNQGPSINNDGATGFRFQLIFNRGSYPGAVVTRCSVFARG